MAHKTIKRNWLKKQIELGNIEIKCTGVYTDDYAFDSAYNYQKSDWKKADIKNYSDQDFKYKSGYAYIDENGLIHWIMLCNHYYECRLIKNPEKPKPEKKKCVNPVDEAIDGEIKVVDYSEKAVAVIGNTKQFKTELKSAGGRFNPHLTVNGNKVAGWIFSRRYAPTLRQMFIKPLC